ncbi:MAG: Circadian phase modifier [Actinomycetia bacterium]|nr:Circadian phase modifier [Actinomycetes bacterium]
MDEDALRRLLDGVRSGEVPADDAVAALRRLPWVDLGFARVDHHRALRQGAAEAVYAPGKTAEQCAAIVAELLRSPGGPVVLTRADKDQLAATTATAPEATVTGTTATWRHAQQRDVDVVLVTAGTADQPVADECAATLTALGVAPTRITDVGVAGLHRLLGEVDRIAAADVVIVVAGMEGALASVVGGIATGPVVAVPTSTGYGAAFEGVTALLGMLASCAAGITVVGIDNGFGAALAVHRILGTTRG